MIPYHKGLRYYLRLDKNGQPVLGSLVARRKKPSGRFIDLTPYINFCCNAEFGAEDIELGVPDNLTLVSGGPGELIISWDPVDGATSYTILIDGVEVFSGGSTGFIATGLVAGATVTVEVYASRGSTDGDPASDDGIVGGTPTTTTTTTSTTTAAPIPVLWMSQVLDPHATLIASSDPFTYTGSDTMASASSDIVIDVHDATAYPDNNFFVIKVPSAVTTKTVWADDPINAPFNNGVIPDSIFRDMVSFGGFDYYYTRVGQIWDHTVGSVVTLS